MARLSRFGVVIAVICIVLILLFLTVKEVGRFATHLPLNGLRAQRALPEEIAFVVAVLLVTILISCKGDESESCLASSRLAFWSIPINLFFSSLRC
jgi:hypothetical protein